jgi:hypothetical protein
VRAVSTAGGFRVPLALVILVLDGFRLARNYLLGGRPRGDASAWVEKLSENTPLTL